MRVLTETQDIVVCGDTIIDLMVYDGFLLPGEAISIEFRGCFEGCFENHPQPVTIQSVEDFYLSDFLELIREIPSLEQTRNVLTGQISC